MRLRVISTGSSANCYLLEGEQDSLLLDAGLPIRKVIPYIEDWRKVAGCLVTHEHGDHARGAAEIARRGVKTYCSTGTAIALDTDSFVPLFNAIQPRQCVRCGEFTIMGFETQHDAAEPFGYLIRNERTHETAIYATDTYYLRYTFPNVTYWIVECNYCDDVLERQIDRDEIDAGLRRRLKESHMSLRRLKDALRANDLSKTCKIVLVHLSDERSDELRMVGEIEHEFGIDTTAAVNGQTIELNRTPF